jgi:hypothetical protein
MLLCKEERDAVQFHHGDLSQYLVSRCEKLGMCLSCLFLAYASGSHGREYPDGKLKLRVRATVS